MAHSDARQVEIAGLYTEEYCRYHRILPVKGDGATLRVMASGVPSADVVADLEETFGLAAEVAEVPFEELEASIRLRFARDESATGVIENLAGNVEDDTANLSETTDVRELANQPVVIRFVNLLIRDAYQAGASDIHVEATGSGLRVRLRIDGVLGDFTNPPLGIAAAVVSRIKLLGQLDIAERRTPQDGRIRVRLEERELDLRVSTVPTLFGESVVIRLLDRGGRPTTLEELGLGPAELSRFSRLVKRPHGLVVVTGPTGSGKTTTLYAALGLRDPTREKIVTVEDPVEYQLPGVIQMPIHVKAGVTFAAALRGVLRQDPDVLMIGEMRDAETAAIGVQAAMTGHLVLTSAHTNSALGVISRMLDLGVERYLVGATLDGVLSQRLVRRTCGACQTPYDPEPAAVALLADDPRLLPRQFLRGAGCAECRGTGFRGRVGLFELVVMSEDFRSVLMTNPDPAALKPLVRAAGAVSVREDGIRKVFAGLTTAEEVLRVLGD